MATSILNHPNPNSNTLEVTVAYANLTILQIYEFKARCHVPLECLHFVIFLLYRSQTRPNMDNCKCNCYSSANTTSKQSSLLSQAGAFVNRAERGVLNLHIQTAKNLSCQRNEQTAKQTALKITPSELLTKKVKSSEAGKEREDGHLYHTCQCLTSGS